MRCLVTGGAGFIGSSCLAKLLERDYECVAIDSFEPTLYSKERKQHNLEWAGGYGDFEFREIDIRDQLALAKLFDSHDFELVVHLAAIAGVRPSIRNAPRYFDINVTGTSRLLQTGHAAGVEDFILASSSSVYGGNQKTPFHERDAVDSPISPYAASKRAKELVAKTHQTLHGGNITCLRFFTVYGPRQRPEMAMHKFMRILDEGGTIPMYGDGSSGRDYTYIDDIVRGVTAAIDQLDGFRIYNLGGDEVIRLKELIKVIADVVGVEPDIEELPMQPGDVPVTSADIGLARQDLGYEPETSLRSGLENMWNWYRETKHLFIRHDDA